MSTTDCEKLGSLALSDSCSNNDGTDVTTSDALDGREVLLTVPATFAEFPLGFALDAGQSNSRDHVIMSDVYVYFFETASNVSVM